MTDLPGTKHLRVEVPRGSSLPAKLMEFGYDVRHSGICASLTPGTADARCLPVDIIDISLSGK